MEKPRSARPRGFGWVGDGKVGDVPAVVETKVQSFLEDRFVRWPGGLAFKRYRAPVLKPGLVSRSSYKIPRNARSEAE